MDESLLHAITDMSRSIEHKSISARPFLRWAGGKSWFLKGINRFLPLTFNDYYEPFLGSAAVFFHLQQLNKLRGNIFLSDLNQELIDCFIQIRDNVEGVIQHLITYRNEKGFYCQIRDLEVKSDAGKAARFIYLNRTSFNGIYRVNLQGIYNVPYGHKKYKTLFDYNNLRICSLMLKGVTILPTDFLDSLTSVEEDDLVFLDPPYTVAHDENGFIKYNQKLFAWEDQIRLASLIKEIDSRGAFYILTNAKHQSIKELFGESGSFMTLSRASVIGGKEARRGRIEEYVFTNTVKKGVIWK